MATMAMATVSPMPLAPQIFIGGEGGKGGKEGMHVWSRCTRPARYPPALVMETRKEEEWQRAMRGE
jgi:hypothetical protein